MVQLVLNDGFCGFTRIFSQKEKKTTKSWSASKIIPISEKRTFKLCFLMVWLAKKKKIRNSQNYMMKNREAHSRNMKFSENDTIILINVFDSVLIVVNFSAINLKWNTNPTIYISNDFENRWNEKSNNSNMDQCHGKLKRKKIIIIHTHTHDDRIIKKHIFYAYFILVRPFNNNNNNKMTNLENISNWLCGLRSNVLNK